MKTQKIGERGIQITFTDPYLTNIYIINGPKHIFINDTFLGPYSMGKVKMALKNMGITQKPFVIFNSHADYDHIWGNVSFKDSVILSHELTPFIIKKEGKKVLEKHASHKQGDVILTPPNTTFTERLRFLDEEIEFFHSPGHTKDSSSCIDLQDNILFVGDNIENPLPYVNFLNFDEYIETLEYYLSLEADMIVSGHSEINEDKSLLRDNLEYLKDLQSSNFGWKHFSDKKRHLHEHNLMKIGRLFEEEKDFNNAIACYKNLVEILKEKDNLTEYMKTIHKFEEKIKTLEQSVLS